VWIVVAVSIASGLAFLIGVLALFAVQVWISIPLAVAGAFGLFRFRLKHRAIYGAIEVPVGLAAIAAAVLPKVFEVVAPTAIGQSLFDIEPADVARLMSVAAGIYVIVRGLDNIDYGISALDTVLSSRPYIKIRVAWELWFRRACRTADEARDKISVERQETAGNQAGGA